MAAQPPTTGLLSPDGNYWWNGSQWVSAVSPDGLWRWDGQQWVPSGIAPRPPAVSVPVYQSPAGRRSFVVVAFAALIVLAAVSAGADFYAGSAALSGDQHDLVAGVPAFFYLVAFVITIVAFLMWLHRAYRNLVALGETNLRFTPGWAVGWWFIPFANLVRPYQVVADLWRRVAPAGTSVALLGVWWGTWLLSNAIDGAASRGNDDVLVGVSNLIDVVPAVLAVVIVLRITAWQEEKARGG